MVAYYVIVRVRQMVSLKKLVPSTRRRKDILPIMTAGTTWRCSKLFAPCFGAIDLPLLALAPPPEEGEAVVEGMTEVEAVLADGHPGP